MSDPLYATDPLTYVGQIPVFSPVDDYIRNYEQISHDHLAAATGEQENPWIDEDLWRTMEDSTALLVGQYAHAGDRILDVGVGLGRLLSRFPHLQRCGVDVSIPYLEIAQGKEIDVCCARAEDLPYRAGIFDIVVCTDVLEHVLDLNACIRKMLFVLKEQGVLIVRVPYRENLSPYLRPEYPYRYAHLRNFDEHSLALLFNRVFGGEMLATRVAGYEIAPARLRYPLPLPKWSGLVSRLLLLTRRLHRRSYQSLLRRLYFPIEINAVFRKTAP